MPLISVDQELFALLKEEKMRLKEKECENPSYSNLFRSKWGLPHIDCNCVGSLSTKRPPSPRIKRNTGLQ